MKIAAFIFARGGSKGLPGKNVKPLNGVPLIAWSIITAKNVSRINRIIVSTDDEEIARIAIEYGAEVPFIRPDSLAKDDSPELLAWQHALEFLGKEENYKPDIMISLPATSPLRSVDDVDKCIDLYLKEPIDGVITVSEANRNPYFNMVEIDINGYSKIICRSRGSISRRQDAPNVYDMNTVCFVVNPSFVFKGINLTSGNIKCVIIPKERSVDIDDLLDFKMAELLISKQ